MNAQRARSARNKPKLQKEKVEMMLQKEMVGRRRLRKEKVKKKQQLMPT